MIEKCINCTRSREVVCKNRKIMIDECIADFVEAINAHPNLRTTSSCCGHGKAKGSFLCADNADRYFFIEIEINDPLTVWEKYRPLHEAMEREKACTKK